MKTDRELRDDVLKELEWDPSVSATHIGVAVEDGIVTLSGYIDSYAEKHAAETAVKRVAGVRGLAEDIEVRLPGSSRRADTDLARAAAAALEWNVAVAHEEIQVRAEDGWITLEGQVEWAHQRDACEREVHDLTGVRGVTNLITVRAKAVAGDVKGKIVGALGRCAARRAQGVQVEAARGIVTLRGKVDSWTERDEAARAAWSAPGVSEVVNLIQVTGAL